MAQERSRMPRIFRVVQVSLICLAGLTALHCGAGNVSKDERLQWFREAKFGMFIHWGPYSNLAGEWNGKQVPVGRNAEWIMHDLRIPVKEYRELARQFNPVKFDARLWAHLAKSTGMKYLVITAKHHDGFAIYHSKVSKYNIVDWTPFKRDPLKELAEACQQEGIRFCVYYSHREDWDDPDAYGNDWDFDVSKKNFERYLEQKSKPQLRELLTGYGPLGLVWFDRGLYTPQQATDFVRLVHSLQPRCLINGRVGNYGQELMGDYQDMNDNGMPTGGLEEYWETPQTLNGTWGYSKFDHTWKTPRTVIRKLVEIVSKGGNYLLNIGPKGDGSIPQPSIDILTKVGAWVRQNGESIYGASASPFPELPWGRCTVKGEKLYLHVFNPPDDGVLKLPGLRNEVRTAYPLLDKSRKLPVSKEGHTASVKMPAELSDSDDTVFVLEIAGQPEVDPLVVTQQGESPVRLDYITAVTAGKAVKRFNREGKFHISKWTGPQDTVTWRMKINKAGRYRVRITYAAQQEWQGGKFRVSIGPDSLTGTVVNTGDWYQYRSFDVGSIELPAAGEYELTIRPESVYQHYLMYLESIELEPLGQTGRVAETAGADGR
jgi:alpha-L-fucosidase